MNNLTITELAKLLRRRPVRAGTAAMAVVCGMMAFVNVFMQSTVDPTNPHTSVRGFAAIRQMKETYRAAAGYLTEDVLYKAGASIEEAFQPR
mgnify:CR=1 FL=1